MSHWLKSVNTLLEKLDDRAEIVVAERTGTHNDDAAGDIHDILAKRGLGSTATEEDDEEAGAEEPGADGWEDSGLDLDDVMEVSNENSKEPITEIENQPTTTAVVQDSKPEELSLGDTISSTKADDVEPSTKNDGETTETSSVQPGDSGTQTDEKTSIEPKTEKAAESQIENSTSTTDTATVEQSKESTDTTSDHANPPVPVSNDFQNKSDPPVAQMKQEIRVAAPHRAVPQTKPEKNAIADAKEAQKEARILRRHVVSLNSQLEAAEAELKAQRKELDLAAERIEKDRKKKKEEKEATQEKHAKELAALKLEHQRLMKEQQAKFEDEIASVRTALLRVEDQRKQEGGNLNKELAHFEEREQEMSNRLHMLEEEKSVLLSQITTLQDQQSALGSRLESLTEAADNAMAREREAEDRLDSVLTQHARQISQRQAREAELERTVSELNAALVASKSRPVSDLELDEDGSGADGALTARIEALQQDLETANSHLSLERERSEALHQQLREMSRESTQEASTFHSKQVHYERRIADMSLTISKLETSLRETQSNLVRDENMTKSESKAEEAKAEQIAVLSEELFRLRDKVASHNSESLTLKSRLQSAIDRAKKAEKELAKVNMNGRDNYDSLELGFRTNGLDRRRGRGENRNSSIRSVMHLDAGQGDRREQLGKVVDVVDSFAVTTGKYLKRNPLARAGFIFYLILIHLWTFVLLFVHAHNFEEHSDFGDSPAHGPHALMNKAPAVTQAKESGPHP